MEENDSQDFEPIQENSFAEKMRKDKQLILLIVIILAILIGYYFTKINTSEYTIGEENIKISKNTSNNYIFSYDGNQIKFDVPDGFESSINNNFNYQIFKKEVDNYELIDVEVSAEYNSLDGYIDEVKEMADYYKNNDFYKNVKITDSQDIIVNGNKFKRIDITYDFLYDEDEGTSYAESYIAYEIDKNNLYVVEIDGVNLMQDDEIKQFLTIEID